MLKLRDFFHLKQVDTLVKQMAAGGPGLVLVTGLDPRPLPRAVPGTDLAPSGRATVFRILLRELLEARPGASCLIVTSERAALRLPRPLQYRASFLDVTAFASYTDQIAAAVHRRPGLLVIDQLAADNAAAAFDAAQGGLCVLSQLDTVFRGADVMRHLHGWGVARAARDALAWVVAVQRIPALCPHCKQPADITPAQRAALLTRYPALAGETPGPFWHADGCPHCDQSGYLGDVIVFDIYHARPGEADTAAALTAGDYVLGLAQIGQIAPDDALQFEAAQLQRTYHLLIGSEQALFEANAALERKLVELQTTHRVLQQRTEALISVHDIGQTLLTSAELDDLAGRICQRARDLCGADRAIFYSLDAAGAAHVLAALGWDAADIRPDPDAGTVLGATHGASPAHFEGWPPGVQPHYPQLEERLILAGLAVPLWVQEQPVGLMIVQTTLKARFTPGEVALLETLAHQAAIAIRRAQLNEQLRAKIAQLEAAQVELAQKERIERELELARQVQQSVLPRTFPLVPGYGFAARNEPARRVGGDFYDVIRLNEEYFGLAVADVSDKGMPAALYMALTRSLLLAEARRDLSPHAVLSRANRLLLELGQPGMFVTLFYGVVDCAAQQLVYARAGHDRPLLLRDNTVHELGGHGLPLGLLGDIDRRLSEERVALRPGDRLVLFTDGLTDVTAPDGSLYSLDKLKALCASLAGLPPGELCEAIFAHLDTFRDTAEPSDDMTLLVMAVEE